MNRIGLIGATVLALGAAPAAASNNVLFILDASNSMWGQLSGVAKIEIAKDAMGSLLGDLPADTDVGLMAYGHRVKDDCADVQLLSPLGSSSPAEVEASVRSIVPRGRTPIAASLAASAGTFDGVEGGRSVVLVSDGVETCDGDPCAAAEALAAADVDVRIHVVGFDLSAEERAQLECIAQKGRGEYFDADSVDGFGAALAEAVEASIALPEVPTVEVAQATTTEAEPEPVLTSVWADDFESFDLDESWTVVNPNVDNYIVEDGALLSISSGKTGMSQGEGASNVFVNSVDLPRGDFDIVFDIYAEAATGRDLIELGLFRDSENYLVARLYTRAGDPCWNAYFGIQKMSGGEATNFTENAGVGGCPGREATTATMLGGLESGTAQVVLSKRGRAYTASLRGDFVQVVGGEEVVWNPTTGSLTSLRTPGQVAIAVSKYDGAEGEVLILVDKVEVLSVE